jgi:hypothetical protein
MKCPFCNASEDQQFRIIGGSDSISGYIYVFNVYECECDSIVKNMVYPNNNEIWISPKNEVKRIES